MKEQLLEALKYFDENDELILQRKEDLERNISQTTEIYKNTIKTQWEQIKELINRIDKAIEYLEDVLEYEGKEYTSVIREKTIGILKGRDK